MKVLFVDNEDDILSLVEIALDGEGIDLTAAGSGSEGFARIEAETFDCFLFDLMMPKPDGRDLVRKVRETPHNATKPVVVCTAKVTASVERDLVEAGATCVLAKPFDPLSLGEYLRDVVTAAGHV